MKNKKSSSLKLKKNILKNFSSTIGQGICSTGAATAVCPVPSHTCPPAPIIKPPCNTQLACSTMRIC